MTKMLASIDPGIRATGVGLFEDGVLVASQYVKNSVTYGLGPLAAFSMAKEISLWLQTQGHPVVDELAMEWPQVYKVSKGDPNDLLPLCGVDAALIGLISHSKTKVISFLPMEWKGQLPKEVMCDRVVSRLTLEEQENIHNVGALTHNVIDSIGVGLHHLGRLTPKKVIPR